LGEREIIEEERTRKPSEPARPKLIKSALNGSIQKWFVDGSAYKDPDVFLHDIVSGVKETVDNVNGPKKVHMDLSCILEKEDPETGVNIRRRTHLGLEVEPIQLPFSLEIHMMR
jgi:hypothetical protein